MKVNTTIPAGLKSYFQKELALYNDAIAKGELQASWRHLERAHIIGQAYPIEHTIVHWKMLCFGVKIKNWQEVVGQIPRLLVGGVKSFVGEIPIGNTGGANVPPLKPMEIPTDLKTLLDEYSRPNTTEQ